MAEELIRVSEGAREQILKLASEKGLSDPAVRVAVQDLAGRVYTLRFVQLAEQTEDDVRLDADGVSLLVDPQSASRIGDATLDFVDELDHSGFRLENPGSPALSGLAARVQEVIDDHVTPMVAQHGGQVLLLDVDEGRVRLEFGGGCKGCGMVDVTLKEGVEALLREAVPEITEILDATEHAAGENPYYPKS